jgi:DNA modification methylase
MSLKDYEYYRTDLGVLYNADCLTIMPELEPVDLVLTDPPYGIGESNEKNLSRGKCAKPTDYGHYKWDVKKVSDKHILETIKSADHSIIFGGNYYVSCLSDSPCWLVWDKDNTGDFADCELAWTNLNTAVRKFKYRWNGMLQECGGKDKEKRYHPTQKPVGLFMQILLKYSQAGWTVLDPFAGSGTTALACERVGRLNWILIEREEKYCEIAAKRIEQERKQLKLWQD